MSRTSRCDPSPTASEFENLLRSDQARRRRVDRVARWALAGPELGPPDARSTADTDDTLLVLYLCCHPSLSHASQIALTLRGRIYLLFNEGYAATSGPHLQRTELAAEAIRLARLLHRLLPDDADVAGLLALLLLTDARRPARTAPRWDADPDGRAGPQPVGH